LHVVSELNTRLKKAGNISASCAELRVEHVIDLKHNFFTDLQGYFIVMFDKLPGGARFEATVFRSKGTFTLKGDVSRINTYDNQTDCVDDAGLKQYCNCTVRSESRCALRLRYVQ
jgi:hypothetical protein